MEKKMKQLKIITLIFITSSLAFAANYKDLKIDKKVLSASAETKPGNTIYLLDSQADIIISTGSENKIDVKATIETGDMGDEAKTRFFEQTSLSLQAYKNGYRIFYLFYPLILCSKSRSLFL